MPYIKQEQRDQLDALINALSDAIHNDGTFRPDDLPGRLNYVITTLVVQVIAKRFGEVRYHVIATMSGVLANVATELYRRVATPYEDRCIAKNGDVPLFEKMSK